jgi:hypothetical protein
MPLPKMRWCLWLLISPVALLSATMIYSFTHRVRQDWEDSKVVAVIEPLVIREFQKLPANSEVLKVFGRFERLSGSGFRHPGAWSLVDRVELGRVAHFEKGQVRTTILIMGDVGPRDACRISFKRWPDEDVIPKLNNYSGPFYKNNLILYEHTYNASVDDPDLVHQAQNEFTLEVWVRKDDAGVKMN